jgi:hypothetical protein
MFGELYITRHFSAVFSFNSLSLLTVAMRASQFSQSIPQQAINFFLFNIFNYLTIKFISMQNYTFLLCFQIATFSGCAVSRLQITGWRLGAAAASTKRYAAHYFSNSALPFLRASCRRCAKPLVGSSLFSTLFFIKLIQEE